MNKKQYISPKVNMVVLNTMEQLLQTSGTEVKNGSASTSYETLSRQGGGTFWDDED